MERLTSKWDDTKVCKTGGCEWQEILQKLAEYEDLEEQGLLLKLPCKVGGAIYFKTYRGAVVSTKVTDILIDSENIIVCDEVANQFDINDFGKTIFLTKAEAEQKLKEMESD